MIQSSTFRKVVIALCTGAALCSVEPCLAQRDLKGPDVLPLTTVQVSVPGQTTGRTSFTAVQWKGQEYQASEGKTVLMQAIIDPRTDPGVRAKALERLSRLRNRDSSVQLMTLYDDLRERDEKAGVIACLTWSQDPRGFPLFARVLDHEKDEMVRLAAAIALAEWNARLGVQELVALLESNAILTQGAHRPYIRDNALDMFLTNNRRKGWGFPEDRIQEEIASRANLDDEQKWVLAISEIKKWFAENEHRFPDWKSGDPLPEVSSGATEQPSKELQP